MTGNLLDSNWVGYGSLDSLHSLFTCTSIYSFGMVRVMPGVLCYVVNLIFFNNTNL